MMMMLRRGRTLRPTAWLVAMSLLLPVCLIGCGGKGGDAANVPPPVDDSARGTSAPTPAQAAAPAKTGMSTGKKAVIALAGAALLYYLYKNHQKQNGQEVQYYKSEKNGRIYYRDAQHQAHWVTPPPGGYQLDPQEQQELSKYQGYNNSTGGEDYKAPISDSAGEPQG